MYGKSDIYSMHRSTENWNTSAFGGRTVLSVPDRSLFTVIPDKGDFFGEIKIPAQGAGKVEVGQQANVKLLKYPYDEYGYLRGKVSSISRITNNINTENGITPTYLVTVSFPDGMTTNFGRRLPLDFETQGQVEIITKRKRLIERLFDNLKAKAEK